MKYINGATFKDASEVAQETLEVDIVSELQLDLANGAKLDVVLRRYAWELAARLDEDADAFEKQHADSGIKITHANKAYVTGLRGAASNLRKQGGR